VAIKTGGGDGVYGYSRNHYGFSAHGDTSYSLYVDGDSYFSNSGIFNGYATFNQGATFNGFVTFNGGPNDVAETFGAPEALSPGDVVVLDPDGGLALRLARQPYDTTVAGVVSTKPAIVLSGVTDTTGGTPLALTGRVPCRVDASFGPIHVGDLLTTSPTAGHAMRVADRSQATGAIIGKALES
jgi:hypothetical protein